MRSMTWIVAGALVTVANVSAAQVPADSLVTGDLVHYELSESLDDIPEESKGTFEALSPSVVVLSAVKDLDGLGPVELPRELIADFEVVRGNKDLRWVGLAVGAAVGMFVLSNSVDTITVPHAVLASAAGGVLFYGVGMLITGPRWEDVEFD